MPSTATRSPRAEWPRSGNRPATRSARTARHSPGDAARTGSWISVLPSGSLIGTERTSAPRTFTSASVPASATPFRRRMRASASHGITFWAAPPLRCAAGTGVTTTSVAATCVEPAHDLVAGGLRQAHRRDQRRHADHRAEHGQPDARRPRHQPGGGLRHQVAQLHLGLGQRSDPASGLPARAAVSFTVPPRSGARPPCAPRGARGTRRRPHA